MISIGTAAAAKTAALLLAPEGLKASLAALSLAALPAGQVLTQNTPVELAERSTNVQYPAMHLYCEKLANQLTEKFRAFSGKARMVVEVRVSQDRLEELQRNLEAYVEAVGEVLDRNRGDWGEGLFYAGGYEATFGPVKHGGKNFLQVAKVAFEVDVSR
jgi:hypothetical protein